MSKVTRITIPGRDVGQANRFIDRVENTTTLAVPSSTVWRETATGRDFGVIAAGLAWPCHPFEGAIVVVGLEWQGIKPIFRVLDDATHDNLYVLVERYFSLAEAWGLDSAESIRWFGSYEHELYGHALEVARRAGLELLLVDLQYKQPSRWTAHCNAILDALGKDKRLFLDDREALRADIGTMSTLWRGHTMPEPEKLPRLVALGRAMEGLALASPPRDIVTMPAQGDPWDYAMGREVQPNPDEAIPTIPDFDVLTEVL